MIDYNNVLPELLSGGDEYGKRYRADRNCPWRVSGQAGHALCPSEYHKSGVCEPLPVIPAEQGTAGSRISPFHGK